MDLGSVFYRPTNGDLSKIPVGELHMQTITLKMFSVKQSTRTLVAPQTRVYGPIF